MEPIVYRVCASGDWSRKEKSLRRMVRELKKRMAGQPRPIQFRGHVLLPMQDGMTLVDVAGLLEAPYVGLPIRSSRLPAPMVEELVARGERYGVEVRFKEE